MRGFLLSLLLALVVIPGRWGCLQAADVPPKLCHLELVSFDEKTLIVHTRFVNDGRQTLYFNPELWIVARVENHLWKQAGVRTFARRIPKAPIRFKEKAVIPKDYPLRAFFPGKIPPGTYRISQSYNLTKGPDYMNHTANWADSKEFTIGMKKD